MLPRVLLCDDETHILRAAEFKLRRAGFEVECVRDGLEAWEAIERSRPAILVTDFQMPRLDGLALCRRVRETPALADLPIVLLTAKGFELAEDRLADELRLVALVTKPFSPRELLTLVQTTLGVVPTAPAAVDGEGPSASAPLECASPPLAFTPSSIESAPPSPPVV